MSKDIKAFIDIVNDSVLSAGNITEQEINELGIRGAGPVSFAAVQKQLQDTMNNLKTLEAEYRKQMQQSQQPQQRQNALGGDSFALDEDGYTGNVRFAKEDMPKEYTDFVLDLKDQVDQHLLGHKDKSSEVGEKVYNNLSNLSDYLTDMAEGYAKVGLSF